MSVHDKDVVSGAMITPESSWARSSESVLLGPATYTSLQHCSIQFGPVLATLITQGVNKG